MIKSQTILLAFALLGSAFTDRSAAAAEIVINPPGGDKDAVPMLVRSLEQARKNGMATIRINPGVYHLYPDTAPERFLHVSNHDHGLRRTALSIWNMENLTIEAQGVTFLAHDQAFIPVTVHDSKNITINGLTIDWAEPLHLQGEVTSVDAATNSFVAMMQHPERIVVKNDQMYFGVFDEKRFATSFMYAPWQLTPQQNWIQNTKWTHWIDSKDGSVLSADKQDNLSDGSRTKNAKQVGTVQALSDGSYKFTNCLPHLPQVGHVFVAKGMLSPNRTSPGLHLQNAEGIVFHQLTIRHAGGMGLIAQRCKDVTISQMVVAPAKESGRWVSTLADATHFNLCQGTIVIKDSTFEYMLDDATNVHGVNTVVVGPSGPNSVLGELMHFQQYGLEFAKAGERIRFAKQNDMISYGERTVKSVRTINASRFELTFTEPIEGFLQAGSYMDNLSCQPDLIFTGNHVANNRARSLIFSTAGKVYIANNRFEQPTNEIVKVTGDANFWFESGPVQDVTIENNTFISRSPASYVFKFGPEEIDLPEKNASPFHANIRVIKNVFYLSSSKIIQAHRVDGLVFRENTIHASQWYTPKGRGKSMDIQRCRHVSIKENDIRIAGLNLDFSNSALTE